MGGPLWLTALHQERSVGGNYKKIKSSIDPLSPYGPCSKVFMPFCIVLPASNPVMTPSYIPLMNSPFRTVESVGLIIFCLHYLEITLL
mgnify:CR=1 FL=1